jgi:hypothetical protein
MKKVALLLVTLAINTSAVRWSDPTYIIDSEHGDFTPVAAYTPDDQQFITWFSGWPTVYYDVSFAQVNEAGELTIPPTRIFEEDGIEDRAGTVTVDSLGHAHIFFRRNTSGDLDIWYTQVDTADGSYLVDPKLLIPAQTPVDWFMYAACDSDDNVHLQYCDRDYDAVEDDWYDAPMYAKLDSGGEIIFSDKFVAQGSEYEAVYRGTGLAVDSDGDAHIVFVYEDFNNPDTYYFTIGYRKMSGVDGTPLTSIIDVGHPSSSMNVPLEIGDSEDTGPAIGVDSNNDIHISYYHRETVVSTTTSYFTAYVKLDNNGNILRSPYDAYSDQDYILGMRNFFITANDRIFLFAGFGGIWGIGVLEFNTDGDVIDTHHCYEHIGDHFRNGPSGCIGPSGYLRIVGKEHTGSDYDVLYTHQVDDSWVFSPLLSANSTEEGLLLTWRSGEADSTWRLTRDGKLLVSLSGRSDYAYLDYSLEPNITYSFSLEAELSDGDMQQFAPVKVAWQPPSSDRLSLSTPYPCPAGDSVTLSYSLPTDTTVAELAIYDLSGRLVDLFPLSPTSGHQTLSVNTMNYRSGVYLATLQTAAETITQRLIVTK